MRQKDPNLAEQNMEYAARIRQTFSDVVFHVTQNCGLRSSAFSLLFLVELLQLLALTFSWEGWGGWTVVFKPFGLDYFLDSFHKGEAHFWFTAIILYFASLVTNISLGWTYFDDMNVSTTVLPKLLRTMNRLLAGVLYLPLLGCFTGFGVLVVTEDTFTLPARPLLAVFSFLFALLLTAQTTFVTSVLFEPRRTVEHVVDGRSHATFDILHHLLKTVFIVCVATLGRPTLSAIVLSCGGLILTLLYLLYQPYYSSAVSTARVIALTLFTWASLAYTATQLLHSDAAARKLLFFMGAPSVLALAYVLVQARRAALRDMPTKQFTSPFELDLHLRCKLQASSFGDEHSESAEDGCGAKLVELCEMDKESGRLQWRRVAYRTPSARVYILWGLFEAQLCRNESMGLKHFQTAARLHNPRVDESFVVERFHRQGELERSDANDSIGLYVKYQKHLELATVYDTKASKSLSRFWQLLLAKRPDLVELNLCGAQTNEAITQARKHYEAMCATKQVPNDLRTFSSFVSEVENNPEEAQLLLDRAEDVEYSRNSQRTEGVDVFDDRNAVIRVSGGEEDLGVVESFSSAGSKIFGYASRDICGRNISVLIPSPFAEMHTSFIRQFLESGESKIVGHTQVLFGQHKNGHLVPIKLHVRQVATAEDDIGFIAVVQALTSDDGLLLVRDGFVTHWNHHCLRYFTQLQPKRSGIDQLGVEKIVPGFETGGASLRSAKGFSFLLSVSGGMEELDVEATAWSTSHEIEDISLEIVRVKFQKVSLEAATSKRLGLNEHEKRRMSKCVFGGMLEGEELEEDEEEEEEVVSAHNSIMSSHCQQNAVPSPAMHHLRRRLVAQEEEKSSEVAESVYSERSAASGRSGRSNRSGKSGKSGKRSHYSTASSTRSALAAVEASRRALLTTKGKSAGVLKKLKLIFLISLSFLLVGATVSFTVSDSQLQEYIAQFELVGDSMQRMIVVLYSTICARTFAYDYDMQVMNHSPDYRGLVFNLLEGLTAEMEELQQRLYFDAKLTSENRRLYEQPSIVVWELQGGQEVKELKSLQEISNLMMSRLQLMQSLTNEEFTQDNEYMYFFFKNSIGDWNNSTDMAQWSPTFDAMNRSATIYMQSARDFAGDIETFELSFMIVCLSILALVLILGFRPVISRVENNKSEVLQMFLDVPKAEVTAQHTQAVERVRRLVEMQGIDSSAEVGAEWDAQMLEEERRMSVDVKTKPGETEQHVPKNERQNKARGENKVRSYHRAQQRAKNILLFKISLIFFVSVAYFVGVYVWSTQLIATTKTSANEASWAGQRQFAGRSFLLYVREYVAATMLGLHDIAGNAFARSAHLLDFIMYSHRSLLFGNDELGLPGSLRRYGPQDQLLYHDACMETATQSKWDGCETFHEGLLQHGLSSAVDEYIRIGREVLNMNTSTVNMYLPQMNFVLLMARWYLDRAFSVSEELYRLEVENKIDVYLDGRVWLLVGFVLFVVLLYKLFYSPLLNQLRRDTVRTQALLLIVPLSIITKVKSIRMFFKERMQTI